MDFRVSVPFFFLFTCVFSYSIPDPKQLPVGVYANCVQPGTVALTFDDGPDLSRTPMVLDVLRETGVKATFFLVGYGNGAGDLDKNAQLRAIVKSAYDQGHQIGSHTWNHVSLTDGLSLSQIEQEVIPLYNTVYGIIGAGMNIFRPPYGSYNATVLDILVQRLGYSVVLWSIDTNDWQHPGDTAAGLQEYARAFSNASPTTSSFISLHHDPFTDSVGLARAAIHYIWTSGYRVVTVAECIGKDMYR